MGNYCNIEDRRWGYSLICRRFEISLHFLGLYLSPWASMIDASKLPLRDYSHATISAGWAGTILLVPFVREVMSTCCSSMRIGASI